MVGHRHRQPAAVCHRVRERGQRRTGLTTNEDVRRLHPAVTRPGRCLATIAVGRFAEAEAAKWLGRPAPAEGATLAELFVFRGEQAPVQTEAATTDHLGADL